MSDRLYVGDVVLHDDAYTAHVTLTLGSREGPFKNAFAQVHAFQRPDYIAFIVCAQPKIPVLPHTVYVNKNAYLSEEHGALHWGPGHVGVAAGMFEGVSRGLLTERQAEDLLCIAVVWIWETATDLDRVCAQTRDATVAALEQAMSQSAHRATLEEAVRRGGFHNPYHALPAQA
jgi:formaldehyde-activating enzyme